MGKVSLKDYAKEESANILNGERLLGEPELMNRFGYDPSDRGAQKAFKKMLYRFRTVRHPSGLLIDCIPVGRKRRLYRLADVMRLEVELLNQHRDRA